MSYSDILKVREIKVRNNTDKVLSVQSKLVGLVLSNG